MGCAYDGDPQEVDYNIDKLLLQSLSKNMKLAPCQAMAAVFTMFT